MTAAIAEIWRYPVKGLIGERLEQVTLSPGETVPHDRRYAIAQGSTAFDSNSPKWLPKTNFLMLMRDEKLAQLGLRFEEAEQRLTIKRGGRAVVTAKLGEPLGRALVAQFFAAFMGDSIRGAPQLCEASGHSFSDVDAKVVSLVNAASVRDLERVLRQPVDVRRFRANLVVDGLPAWEEFKWLDRDLTVNGVQLKVTDRINRCAAPNVNPETAERDLNIPKALQQGFGHTHMGIYLQVVSGGQIAIGNELEPADKPVESTARAGSLVAGYGQVPCPN